MGALQDLVDDYLADCRARGLSLKTIKDRYELTLARVFLPWCKKQGIESPDHLTGRVLVRFSGHLQEHGGAKGKLSPHTIATYVSTVNYFVAWATREGELRNVRKAPTPRLPTAILEVLSPTEVGRMMEVAGNDRDRLIIRLLWETGCRGSELLGLRVGDLDERDRKYNLLFHGRTSGGGAKGDRGRIVPIPRLGRELRRYIRSRPQDVYSDRVFLARRRDRRTEQYEPLTLSGLEQLVRNVAREAGIGRRVWLHLIRHSAVTNMLRRGVSPVLVAQVVGHSSLEMINRVYAHLSSDDAYEAMVAYLSEP